MQLPSRVGQLLMAMVISNVQSSKLFSDQSTEEQEAAAKSHFDKTVNQTDDRVTLFGSNFNFNSDGSLLNLVRMQLNFEYALVASFHLHSSAQLQDQQLLLTEVLLFSRAWAFYFPDSVTLNEVRAKAAVLQQTEAIRSHQKTLLRRLCRELASPETLYDDYKFIKINLKNWKQTIGIMQPELTEPETLDDVNSEILVNYLTDYARWTSLTEITLQCLAESAWNNFLENCNYRSRIAETLEEFCEPDN